MNNDKYYNALRDSLDQPITENIRYALRLAAQIDDTRERMYTSAKSVARNFEEIAIGVSKGYPTSSNPLSNSALYDYPILLSRFTTLKDSFTAICDIYLNAEELKNVQEMLEKEE